MSMGVHQTARFSNNPMLSHEKAPKRLGRYILLTKRDGIIYNPDTQKGLEYYVDADFAGGWQQADSSDAENVMSQNGMVIIYANYPIYWHSSLKNRNHSKYYRSKVHCIIICFTRCVAADGDDGRNQQIISSPHTKTQVRMSSP